MLSTSAINVIENAVCDLIHFNLYRFPLILYVAAETNDLYLLWDSITFSQLLEFYFSPFQCSSVIIELD